MRYHKKEDLKTHLALGGGTDSVPLGTLGAAARGSAEVGRGGAEMNGDTSNSRSISLISKSIMRSWSHVLWHSKH